MMITETEVKHAVKAHPSYERFTNEGKSFFGLIATAEITRKTIKVVQSIVKDYPDTDPQLVSATIFQTVALICGMRDDGTTDHRRATLAEQNITIAARTIRSNIAAGKFPASMFTP